jgi:hypothetical protein
MFRTGKFRQLFGKSSHFGPFNEGARRHDAADGFVEFRLDFGVLPNEVNHVDFLFHQLGLKFKNTPAQRGYLPNDSKKLTPHW